MEESQRKQERKERLNEQVKKLVSSSNEHLGPLILAESRQVAKQQPLRSELPKQISERSLNQAQARVESEMDADQ